MNTTVSDVASDGQPCDGIVFTTAVGRPYSTCPGVVQAIQDEAETAGPAAMSVFDWAWMSRGRVADRPAGSGAAETLDWLIEGALFDPDTCTDDEDYTSPLAVAVRPLTDRLAELDPQLWEYDVVHLLLFATEQGIRIISTYTP